MSFGFAGRMVTMRKSFIREILKVTERPEVISFAGGLPNPRFFPVQEVAAAAEKVLATNGQRALQYSTTEGYPPLRQYIARRYEIFGLDISPDDILITTGSQQGLDLIGKICLNSGDHVLLEQPGYLGAIQAFSLYEPIFHQVPLGYDGIDLPQCTQVLQDHRLKLFYTVPNFQNPSGITYSQQKRSAVSALMADQGIMVVEDNPYAELRFVGEHQPSFKNYLNDNIILLGSFSKIVAPALRLGWLVAPPPVMEHLIIAKQASDLHTNSLSQHILHQYLLDNDLDVHLARIKFAYRKQCELMVSMLEEYFPADIKFTRPEGGMFIWVFLPEHVSAMAMFDEAARRDVVFVPGLPFYVDGGGDNSLRLNFSNATEADIEVGITRLAQAYRKIINEE